MKWSKFLEVFSSNVGFWNETTLTSRSDRLSLIDSVDGTTNLDHQTSDQMIKYLKQYFGPDVQVLSEEEDNYLWQGTGFIIDPIDGSWNFYSGYPAYCRVVSYIENGDCLYFTIFDEVNKKSVCSNGESIIYNGERLELPSIINPMIAVMYNMHYCIEKKNALIHVFEQLMKNEQNIRISGSPSHDLYSLLIGAVGGVINLSPHRFDAEPIINCLRRSPLFEIKSIIIDHNMVGQFIRRNQCSDKLRNLI